MERINANKSAWHSSRTPDPGSKPGTPSEETYRGCSLRSIGRDGHAPVGELKEIKREIITVHPAQGLRSRFSRGVRAVRRESAPPVHSQWLFGAPANPYPAPVADRGHIGWQDLDDGERTFRQDHFADRYDREGHDLPGVGVVESCFSRLSVTSTPTTPPSLSLAPRIR